jgi:FhaA, N-terminal domain/FHA domain
MRNGISRLESRVEHLVEGTFARLFAGRLHPREVALQLARAMEDYDPARAPEHYEVRLNPRDAEALLVAEPALAARLEDELITLARDSGLALACRPDVEIVADPAVAAHSVTVEAGAASGRIDGTAASTPISQRATPPEPAPEAYLIVDGRRHVALDQPLITVGRRRDNHLVLDDSRVSRVHCQIRLRYGHWVVFDLGSSAGTQVNGEAVEECVLRPGDVISLAGVTLIYGEDDLPDMAWDGDTGHTRPIHP